MVPARQAARAQLAAAFGQAPQCVAVHAVFAPNALQVVVEAGARQVVTCNTLPHPSNAIDVSPEELARTGVGEDTVRLSVGIEHIDDIIADLNQALAAAATGLAKAA